MPELTLGCVPAALLQPAFRAGQEGAGTHSKLLAAGPGRSAWSRLTARHRRTVGTGIPSTHPAQDIQAQGVTMAVGGDRHGCIA